MAVFFSFFLCCIYTSFIFIGHFNNWNGEIFLLQTNQKVAEIIFKYSTLILVIKLFLHLCIHALSFPLLCWFYVQNSGGKGYPEVGYFSSCKATLYLIIINTYHVYITFKWQDYFTHIIINSHSKPVMGISINSILVPVSNNVWNIFSPPVQSVRLNFSMRPFLVLEA